MVNLWGSVLIGRASRSEGGQGAVFDVTKIAFAKASGSESIEEGGDGCM